LKAVLEEDIIINITERGTVEIGQLPSGIGLERLRWNGSKIIDLAELSEIWVRKTASGFQLHCVEVPGSQLVQMTYADRKNLTTNGGAVRIKTAEELEAERITKLVKLAKSKLSSRWGEMVDLQLAELAMIAALIVYARNQPPQLGEFFDSIIPNILDAFPLNRWETILQNFLSDLKQFISDYYSEIDSI